jgi:YVTN family beta-propeller protein
MLPGSSPVAPCFATSFFLTHKKRLSQVLAALTVVLVSAPLSLMSQTGVHAVLPDGREIRPAGNWISTFPFPFAIALKKDGSEATVPSIGYPFGLNIISHPDAAQPDQHRLPAKREQMASIEAHAGVAYSPDGTMLYVATGNTGKITVYNTSDWQPLASIALNGTIGDTIFKQSFAATVQVSSDGHTLYALDQGNWRIVVIDAIDRKVIASIPTGRYPFDIALSPDGNRLYVTNIGIFEYTTIPGAKEDDQMGTGLKFAPFGYPSKEAREGTTVEGRKIPGLGDENSNLGSSLWAYDIHDREHPSNIAKLRLGERITPTRIGGTAPTGVVAGEDAVYVSLAHQDSVVKVSADGKRVLGETALTPFTGKKFEDSQGHPLRGVMPSGLALRHGRLYVAESGIDAVAVVDTAAMHVIEHIPAGWNPSAVAVSPDGKTLYIVNAKGKGSGANAGKLHDPKTPTYVGALEYGSVSAVTLATLPDPQTLTGTVVAANTFAIANQPPLPRLKHCFLVVRENRTYDEVLGDIEGANGDPSLARYGMDGWEGRTKTVMHLHVTPNLHALARQFAMSDNFFVDSDVSADGHRWVVGINPTPFFNTAWTSGYAGRRDASSFAAQPGRRAFFGGADAPMPEDEPQFGSIWEHIANSGKGILNYGEGLEVEGNSEMDGTAPEGQRLFLNAPVPKPIFESTDRLFPTFNVGIPDQFRADEFEKDFQQRLGQDKIPGLIVIRLPNDHTSSPRPADGYPYRASYVADNDLALGRIIEFLSKTSIWKDSAMFVTEDDAQNGVDHVDAHRSILLVASPWVVPGTVSHQHTSMGSITRTINELLGVGPLNLEDALAGDITGIFAPSVRDTPYVLQASDLNVFDPAKARFARPKTKKEAEALLDMDDADEIRKQMEKDKDKLRRPTDAR